MRSPEDDAAHGRRAARQPRAAGRGLGWLSVLVAVLVLGALGPTGSSIVAGSTTSMSAVSVGHAAPATSLLIASETPTSTVTDTPTSTSTDTPTATPTTTPSPTNTSAPDTPTATPGGPNTWIATGSMTTGRAGHTATLLPNGKVLVTGGCGYPCTTTELYDPSTGTWTPTGSMTAAGWGYSATLLKTGQVLVAGGCCSGGYVPYSSAELYDPRTGTWTPTGSMPIPRVHHTATLLSDGRVLVAGGETCCTLDVYQYYTPSAALYDPRTGTWTPTGSMTTIRDGMAPGEATATLLNTGKVLVTGGYNGGCPPCTSLSSAELYDPGTGTWAATGSMTTARVYHTATLLSNGKVLVVGGQDTFGHELASAEVYDPSTGTWTATGSMPDARSNHTATLLPTGQVLVAGGWGLLASAELYDPSSGLWTVTNSMTTGRNGHTATLLSNGQVLVAGGYTNNMNISLASAELYLPDLGPFGGFNPNSLYFGDQQVGTRSVAQNVTLTNFGTAPLTIARLSLAGSNAGDFTESDTCSGVSLAPKSSCNISVSFVPTDVGIRSAEVSIIDNAGDSPQSMPLTGYGLPASPGTTAVSSTNTPVPGAARALPTATRVICALHPRAPSLTVGIAPGVSLPRTMHRRLPFVTGGGTLPLTIRTAPHATIAASLDVVVTQVVIHGTGAHRTHTTRRAVLYHTSLHGSADATGRYSPQLHVAYQPKRPVVATLTVQARTTCGTAARRTSLSILPLRITVTPHRLVGGRPVTITLHTGAKGQVSITLEVDTTRDTVIGQGTQRRYVRRVVALYRLRVTGTADTQGQFSRRVAIAYQPRTPMLANIAVTVRLPQGTATGAATAMLLPPRSESLPPP
jgi:hypothetical protein